MPIPTPMIGRRFTRLLVLEQDGKGANGFLYSCQCDCGTVKTISGPLLRDGKVKSCGCLKSEMIAQKNMTHGKSDSSAYQSWQAMKNRCLNPNQPAYKNYGGRGIKICAAWFDFDAFYKDMGDRPKGTTLERKDNNLGYNKENCIWATVSEQSKNTRQVVKLTHNGMTMVMKDWARYLGIPYPTIQDRRRRGWPVERILSV